MSWHSAPSTPICRTQYICHDRGFALRFRRLFAWLLLAPGYTWTVSAPFGIEAQVLVERIGPQGTSAEDRDLSDGLGAPTGPSG